MESATKKSLLGKYQLITEFKQNRPNNNKPQYIDTSQRRFNNSKTVFFGS